MKNWLYLWSFLTGSIFDRGGGFFSITVAKIELSEGNEQLYSVRLERVFFIIE